MKNFFSVLALFVCLLGSNVQAQFFPSTTADNRTGWSIGVNTATTNCDIFDNGVDRLVTYVAYDSTCMFSYILVNDPVWGGLGNYLPMNSRYHDVVISHSFGANHYILNVTYYDPAQGMVLEQIDYYVGSGFSSSVVTVLDSMIGNTMPLTGPRIDIDQENCHAAIVWHNPAQNVMKAVHLNFYLGLTVKSPVNILPFTANCIEPDVAVTMEAAYFTFLNKTRKDVYMMEVTLNDLDHNSGAFQAFLMLKTLHGFDHYNPRIATSCMNTKNHGDWTIVVGAGTCTSAGVYGWSGSGSNIYTSLPHNYTNSFTWLNKTTNKYQMDNGNSLNLFPVVTYQHSNGNTGANYFQVAWQTTDALNNYMGKVAGTTTIVSVTCDNIGNPIAVGSTSSAQPEFQIVPHYYSASAMPPINSNSGVNNFNSQSAVSLAGRNSQQNTQLAVYFDAYNVGVNKPTWNEAILKENVSAIGGFKTQDVQSVSFETPASVRIFPNPVSNQITLQSETLTSDMNLSVYDVNGRLLMQQKASIDQLNMQLNELLPSLVAGTYLVEIFSDNGSLVLKHKMLKAAN